MKNTRVAFVPVAGSAAGSCRSLQSSIRCLSWVGFNDYFLWFWCTGLRPGSSQACPLCPWAGDCVYLMRDSRRTPDGHPVRQSYRLLSHINRDKLDIFRIEKLWKNDKYVQNTPFGFETAHGPAWQSAGISWKSHLKSAGMSTVQVHRLGNSQPRSGNVRLEV